MDDVELRELQDPETWEDIDDGDRPPVRASRAIVSVAFARPDFDEVVAEARNRGMKTSEFIRWATLECLRRSGADAVVTAVTGGVRTALPPSIEVKPKVEVRVPPPPTYSST